MAANKPKMKQHFRRRGNMWRDYDAEAIEFLNHCKKDSHKAILRNKYHFIQRIKCETLLTDLDLQTDISLSGCNWKQEFKIVDEGSNLYIEDEGEDGMRKPYGPLTEAEADLEIVRNHFLILHFMDEELIKETIKELENVPDINPFIVDAVWDQDLDTVNALLRLGSNVNAKGKFGQTSVHAAVIFGSTLLLELLVSKGGDLTMVDDLKHTCLHLAVQEDWSKTVHWLLDRGAAVNAKDCTDYTPLHWAVFNANVSLVKILLGRGAKVNIRNMEGCTPFEIAQAIGTPKHKIIASILKFRAVKHSLKNLKK